MGVGADGDRDIVLKEGLKELGVGVDDPLEAGFRCGLDMRGRKRPSE
ncbi:hypothetical protein [Saliphagus sp. LR7]|nr:hypothetical protein [Saliphagus sp. LR7]